MQSAYQRGRPIDGLVTRLAHRIGRSRDFTHIYLDYGLPQPHSGLVSLRYSPYLCVVARALLTSFRAPSQTYFQRSSFHGSLNAGLELELAGNQLGDSGASES
jgi:hypothetical protein